MICRCSIEEDFDNARFYRIPMCRQLRTHAPDSRDSMAIRPRAGGNK